MGYDIGSDCDDARMNESFQYGIEQRRGKDYKEESRDDLTVSTRGTGISEQSQQIMFFPRERPSVEIPKEILTKSTD